MSHSPDPLETEETKRRLDAISEISRNARATLLALNLASLFVIFGVSSLTFSTDLEPYFFAMNDAFEEFRNADNFDAVLTQADLPGWDWSRKKIGIGARKDAEALLAVTLKNDGANNCSLPPKSPLIGAACNLKRTHDAFTDKLLELEQSSIQLKTLFFQQTFDFYYFLPISTLIILAIYIYILINISEFGSRFENIKNKLDEDLLHAILHPWMLTYAVYGNFTVKILFLIMVNTLPIIAMAYLMISYTTLYKGAGSAEYNLLDWIIMILLFSTFFVFMKGIIDQIRLIFIDENRRRILIRLVFGLTTAFYVSFAIAGM